MQSDVFLDGIDQFRDAMEDAPAQSFGGEVAKEPLDHVQPRGRGRGEMHMNARVLGQPLLYLRVFVRRIVIEDQVQFLLLGRLPVDTTQEPQPFLVTVALLTAGDDRAIERIECGKERCGAMALVIVGQGGRHVPSSGASQAGVDPGPAPGFSHRSKAPRRARVGSGTSPQSFPISRQSADRARP